MALRIFKNNKHKDAMVIPITAPYHSVWRAHDAGEFLALIMKACDDLEADGVLFSAAFHFCPKHFTVDTYVPNESADVDAFRCAATSALGNVVARAERKLRLKQAADL